MVKNRRSAESFDRGTWLFRVGVMLPPWNWYVSFGSSPFTFGVYDRTAVMDEIATPLPRVGTMNSDCCVPIFALSRSITALASVYFPGGRAIVIFSTKFAILS